MNADSSQLKRRSMRVAIGLVGVVLLVILCARIADAGGNSGTRESLVPGPVASWLDRTPHRLAILYWPSLRGCTVCDALLMEKLTQWLADPARREELIVATVVPAGVSARHVGANAFPGLTVEVDSEEYSRAAALAPRPRIEIWSAAGELLLLRSIPSNASQVELLDEELLAALWFTPPLGIRPANP